MIMGLKDVLHKIVDVAAGDNARQDLHDEIDELDEPSAEPAEPVQAPQPAPVDDGVQVQEQVQEDGSAEAES